MSVSQPQKNALAFVIATSMMFSRAVVLTISSMPLFAAATPLEVRQTCSTGAIQCCQTTTTADSDIGSALLGLLGIAVQDVTSLISLYCSPISVVGVGSGNGCSAKAVCCENNNVSPSTAWVLNTPILNPQQQSLKKTIMSSTKMQYVRLGNSGLKVSKIILGCMQYGHTGWNEWVLGEEEALEHIKFAYENGIQTFDTANVYSNGLSEVILGNVIKKLNLPREELVIMTKLHGAVAPDYGTNLMREGKKPDEVGLVNQYGQSRKHIFASVKASLKRLQLDYIDLLRCHRFDYNTPIEETMQALHDVVKAGYVRYIGMSSCWAYQFHAMQNYAISHNLTPFISMQNHYSLVYREEEREMFPTLKLFGVGSIPWSPLARGLLARPLGSQNTKRGSSDMFIGAYNKEGSGTPEILKRVEELAKKKRVSMAQISIAWILAKDGVTAPIVGTTSLDNLKDIIAGVNVSLTPEEIKYLEEPYNPLPINGHS
ncbi:NADP-dependent oxidoreductase domain-containing protein [Trametes polyzona]|nr:NADP-dependent oxidoreductase domain-containing protein [Trametes polyzona]